MDASKDRFAYRCLPLVIASSYGWQVLTPWGFSCIWNGRPEVEAITIIPDPGGPSPAISHFGAGVLTFHFPAVFRTDPGYDLMMMGPINQPKDAIQPLTGIIETDWLPFTSTMNWLVTRPGAPIRFERGEPFCQVFPLRRGEAEEFDPVIRPIGDDPELFERYKEWCKSREAFTIDSRTPGSEATRQKWQKFYQRGTDAGRRPLAGDHHRLKVRLRRFRTTDEAPDRAAWPNPAKAQTADAADENDPSNQPANTQ
jgi:hypothetical protein